MRKYLLFPLILVAYEISTYLSNDMYLPALPTMMRDMQMTLAGAQATLTFWFVGTASLQLIIGPLADQLGRRPVILFGGVIYVIASIVCASTTNAELFLFARFLQGTAVCSAIVAGYATIHDSYDDKMAIKILALMGSITILAPIFGPLIGGVLIEYFLDWRGIFWLLAIVSSLSIALLYFFMPETSPASRSIKTLLQTVKNDYLNLVTNINFIFKTLAYSFLFAGLIAWIVASPMLIIDHYQQSEIMFGVIQMLVFGSFIFGTILVKRLMVSSTVSRIIMLAISLIILGSISLLAVSLNESLALSIVALMIFGLGCGLFFSPMQRLAISSVEQSTAMSMAMFSFIMSLAGAFGSYFVSVYFSNTLVSISTIIVFFSTLSIGFTLLLKRSEQLDLETNASST